MISTNTDLRSPGGGAAAAGARGSGAGGMAEGLSAADPGGMAPTLPLEGTGEGATARTDTCSVKLLQMRGGRSAHGTRGEG